MSLVNSIVEPRLHLTDVVINNPFNLAAYKGAKETIVDIKAVDQDGNWYGIEMQVLGHKVYGKRAIFYVAKGYVDQLESGVRRGQVRLICRQLTRHIGGGLPGNIASRLESLTPNQLDDLGEAIFDLNTYADVEAWLSRAQSS